MAEAQRTPLEWEAARESVAEIWRRIHERAGTVDEIDLLTDINAVCDFCSVAKEASGNALDPCPYCPFYEQFGGCRAITLAIGERLVAGDRKGIAELAADFLDKLGRLELPPAG